MANLPLPRPSCIQYPRPSELNIGRLLYHAEIIDEFFIAKFQKYRGNYDNSTTTSPECWRIEKQRLDNYCKFWDHSKLKFWGNNREPPKKLLETPFLELQGIADRISDELCWTKLTLHWQHKTKAPPKVRLKDLKWWVAKWNPTKACPLVRIYRIILELYEFSVEQGWIKNMDGFGKKLSPSELEQRNLDYKKYIDDLIQKLENQVAVLDGSATAKKSS